MSGSLGSSSQEKVIKLTLLDMAWTPTSESLRLSTESSVGLQHVTARTLDSLTVCTVGPSSVGT